MTVPKEPLSASARLWRSIAVFAKRWGDMVSFNARRLEAIENRLAALDGGDDAAAAQRAALSITNINRVAAGGEPLCFTVVDGKVVWDKAKIGG